MQGSSSFLTVATHFEKNQKAISNSEYLSELCLNDTKFGDNVAELLAKSLQVHRTLKRLQVCG